MEMFCAWFRCFGRKKMASLPQAVYEEHNFLSKISLIKLMLCLQGPLVLTVREYKHAEVKSGTARKRKTMRRMIQVKTKWYHIETSFYNEHDKSHACSIFRISWLKAKSGAVIDEYFFGGGVLVGGWLGVYIRGSDRN